MIKCNICDKELEYHHSYGLPKHLLKFTNTCHKCHFAILRAQISIENSFRPLIDDAVRVFVEQLRESYVNESHSEPLETGVDTSGAPPASP